MERVEPIKVVFYMTSTGSEPVRDWLHLLQKNEKKQIGEDIKTVQFGWPLGMPIVEKLDRDLWEVRTKLRDKISRVLFTIQGEQIILLHGFIKKSQKISIEDLELAQRRLNDIKRG
ncbi:MAG: type II toxin-antitoxin system RelE/ParE family toxin [Candidatus Omnitrophica bacterium]|nr:type II toxin-antitoxin system RelE/ParE family toxin [Candidatus Omnitrophota bacterium]